MNWLFEPERPWRPIDAALTAAIARRWPDTSPEVLRLLASASFAAGQGHTAVDLGALDSGAAALGLPLWSREHWLDRLADCPAVGVDGESRRPFVLDRGLLYLRRFHRDEVRLAERLTDLARPVPMAAAPGAVAAHLRALFPETSDLLADRQALACLASLSTRFTVVLGGPGTGKTTTVLRLLALHQSLAGGSLTLAVAAPTGKAAARVAEAMQAAADRLRLDPDVRAMLPMRAQTLHRLLGARADGARFRHGADFRLPYDLVVLDEASMVDLTLFARLVDALPDHARLVVLGDPDQLEAIESGAVLGELTRLAGDEPDPAVVRQARACLAVDGRDDAEAFVPPSGVHACVIRLIDGWRFARDSGIARLTAAVRSGNAEEMQDILRDRQDDVAHIDAGPDTAAETLRRFVRDRYAAAAAGEDVESMLASHRRFRVLAATRADAARANTLAAASLGQRHRAISPEPGLPFLIERNNALRELHNGDTGVFALDESGDLHAWLPNASGVAGCIRALAPHEIGSWQPAYAMTVHRAQGSEYDDVMVLLPDRMNRAMSRPWLYTAISRARRRLFLLGRASVLVEAVRRHELRISALATRLMELHCDRRP